MKQKKIQVIIDSDPGIDDALALILALSSEKLDVKLVASVAGNLPIEITTRNVLHIVEKLGKNVPVVRGAGSPMRSFEPYGLKNVHGESGFGSYTFTPPLIKEEAGEAHDIMFKTLKRYRGKKTVILALGPLTNIGKLLEKYPNSRRYIDKIVFMGGSKEAENMVDYVNNTKDPYPEFNINYDPESVEIVLSSGVECVMVPMEMGHNAYLANDDIDAIKNMGPIGEMLFKMFETYNDGHVMREDGVATHDSATTAYLIMPELFKTESAKFEMKWFSGGKNAVVTCELVYGNISGIHKVCVDIDELGFKGLVFNALRNLYC